MYSEVVGFIRKQLCRRFLSLISRRVCCHPHLSGSLRLILKAVCRGGKKKMLPELQRSNYRGRQPKALPPGTLVATVFRTSVCGTMVTNSNRRSHRTCCVFAS